MGFGAAECAGAFFLRRFRQILIASPPVYNYNKEK